ncbi:hypothetical protein ACFP3U_00210 [Kitasatospora misakiensis]|uniref:Uncharacterized protein n=1 Tax=Kitasatospora misakiensis TaxID=67330 RepID=A0ABW0WYT4_9ACTN
MADLEFERRMNPWLFDSSGNLTAEAKQQFPDLAGANAAPVSLAGGQTLKADPPLLQKAAQNAHALQAAVKTELTQPAQHVAAAAAALSGWETGGRLTTAWSIWSDQANNLSLEVGRLAGNLDTTARNYAQTEAAIHAQFAPQQ